MRSNTPRCPRCFEPIRRHQVFGSSIVCQCGWSASSTPKQIMRNYQRRTAFGLFMFSAILIGGLIHFSTWGGHSGAVVILKAKEVASLTTAIDMREFAKICMDRKYYDMAEDSLVSAYEIEANTETLAELGILQAKLRKDYKAMQTFAQYFKDGGTDFESQYEYAKALDRNGHFKQAREYYLAVLAAKPDTIQTTVAQNYVKMLMRSNQLRSARSLIADYRRKGTNTSLFLEQEWQEIQRRIATN